MAAFVEDADVERISGHTGGRFGPVVAVGDGDLFDALGYVDRQVDPVRRTGLEPALQNHDVVAGTHGLGRQVGRHGETHLVEYGALLVTVPTSVELGGPAARQRNRPADVRPRDRRARCRPRRGHEGCATARPGCAPAEGTCRRRATPDGRHEAVC
jgi:hypothetical protein